MADLLMGMTLKEAKRLDDALSHLKNSYSHLKANKPFKRLYLVEIAETLLKGELSNKEAQTKLVEKMLGDAKLN